VTVRDAEGGAVPRDTTVLRAFHGGRESHRPAGKKRAPRVDGSVAIVVLAVADVARARVNARIRVVAIGAAATCWRTRRHDAHEAVTVEILGRPMDAAASRRLAAIERAVIAVVTRHRLQSAVAATLDPHTYGSRAGLGGSAVAVLAAPIGAAIAAACSGATAEAGITRSIFFRQQPPQPAATAAAQSCKGQQQQPRRVFHTHTPTPRASVSPQT
jgi:hypothetical protein